MEGQFEKAGRTDPMHQLALWVVILACALALVFLSFIFFELSSEKERREKKSRQKAAVNKLA